MNSRCAIDESENAKSAAMSQGTAAQKFTKSRLLQNSRWIKTGIAMQEPGLDYGDKSSPKETFPQTLFHKVGDLLRAVIGCFSLEKLTKITPTAETVNKRASQALQSTHSSPPPFPKSDFAHVSRGSAAALHLDFVP